MYIDTQNVYYELDLPDARCIKPWYLHLPGSYPANFRSCQGIGSNFEALSFQLLYT